MPSGNSHNGIVAFLSYVSSSGASGEAWALDTETTGLRPFHGDRPFSIVLCDGASVHYIETSDLVRNWGAHSAFAHWLGSVPRLFYMHNAKFDIHHLAAIDLHLHPDSIVHDTMVGARLIQSDLRSVSLDNVAQVFLGERKDDKVKEYILKNGLYEMVDVPGKKVREKRMFYDKVPLELIKPYAEQDAMLTYRLGKWQELEIAQQELTTKKPLTRVLHNERHLTTLLAIVESKGVRVDRGFCESAIAYEEKRLAELTEAYASEAGVEYKASGKSFAEVFSERGVDLDELPRTEGGSVQFDARVLESIQDPLAKLVLDAKDAKARLNFFHGFLWQADATDTIHPDFAQAGTVTGRFSCRNPNLQNLAKSDGNDTGPYPVRRAIIPREDYCFVMIDYSQQEYRLMLDYAAEMELIEAIKGGMDVHTATADLVGISRSEAKTLNFALIYGAGNERLAETLGVSVAEAASLKKRMFSVLPRVQVLIKDIRAVAAARGYVVTWAGRKLSYSNARDAWRASNHLIQGGCADITRLAMVSCMRALTLMKSRLVLTVHDELVFEIHKSELDIAQDLAAIMVAAYTHRYLPMAVEVSHSWKSLEDKTTGYPQP